MSRLASYHTKGLLEAGCDEAGRGCLAGPVVAAAVILDPQRRIKGLADSKVLTALRRERLNDLIRAQALCVSVGMAEPSEIDALNILQATLLAMRRAVQGLRLPPRHVLVDGNCVPPLHSPTIACQAIVKGDARVAEISAASEQVRRQVERLVSLSFRSSQQPVMQPRRVFQVVS